MVVVDYELGLHWGCECASALQVQCTKCAPTALRVLVQLPEKVWSLLTSKLQFPPASELCAQSLGS